MILILLLKSIVVYCPLLFIAYNMFYILLFLLFVSTVRHEAAPRGPDL